ncbi:PEP-CTERM sorting domain-containing protein [Coraliomargarita sp. SDUM461003]|uniref:PEP-CTERM sorting domain-containing protein n=1 Tax=Thalassobacterium maritimum TaxID=3041265 RepID=A0ABU1AWL5_9BACT|nr:PEP-CTERM sorting domain-containing protein [Coraliomargarita sp. SDUM461003]MDQ8208546.1 PEP-CTERM sorting domain-containing protein [Coraliomargarita sp. SDUM461003]
MKYKALKIGLLTTFAAATSALANISMDFTNMDFTPVVTATGGSSFVIDSAYKVSDVADLGGVGGINEIYAIFTITDASHNNSSRIYFQSGTARGDDVRMILDKGGAADIWAKVSVQFFDKATDQSVNVAAVTGDSLRLQFDDLDSNVGNSRADYAGLQTSQILDSELASNTILTQRTDLASGYTVGVLPDDGDGAPYDSYGNITSTNPVDQSPVTAAFDTTAEILNLVLGVTGTGTGTRLIDIDMTPDFVIVPEPASFTLLIGALSLGFVSLRRRR